MHAKEVVRCALQIERSAAQRSYGNVVTLLGDLDKLQITAEQLETTDIVQVLYRLRKTCRDEAVKKATKSLLSKWKRQYSKDKGGVKCTEDRGHRELSCRVSPPEETCESRVEETEEEASSSVSKAASSSTENPSDFSSVRPKCVDLLLAALHPDLDPNKAAELAGDIEQRVHELHSSNLLRYKACVRSKVANLRNPKNKHLQRGLLSGSLSPEAFARMSAEEMACAELRQLREEFSSRGVSERQLPQGVKGTPTQRIRCKRCGGSDCSVTQVSRGALFLPAWVRRGGPDDDALTFVTCSGCGQQWYHSRWVCL